MADWRGDLPAGVRVRGSLDGVEVTLPRARPEPPTATAGGALALGAAYLILCLPMLGLVALVAGAGLAGQVAAAVLGGPALALAAGAVLAWGRQRARPATLRLSGTRLHVRSGLHSGSVLLDEIVLVVDGRRGPVLALRDGRRWALAPSQPGDVQSWLAGWISDAHARHALGSSADVPAALRALAAGLKQSA